MWFWFGLVIIYTFFIVCLQIWRIPKMESLLGKQPKPNQNQSYMQISIQNVESDHGVPSIVIIGTGNYAFQEYAFCALISCKLGNTSLPSCFCTWAVNIMNIQPPFPSFVLCLALMPNICEGSHQLILIISRMPFNIRPLEAFTKK
jgi:hypothetical protein